MKSRWSVFFLFAFIFSSCVELMQIAQQTPDVDRPLPQSEIIAGLKPVETKLDEYLTGKALDGLFLKTRAKRFFNILKHVKLFM